MKYEYLVSLSTTTKIEFLVANLGKPSTKSMDINVHARVGMGSGSKRPGY
jgi:hypothetical protein